MSKATFLLRQASVFPPDTEVGAFPRLTDAPPTALPRKAAATATVDKRGEAKLSGLEPNAPYWAAADVDGTVRTVAFTAKSDELRNMPEAIRLSRDGTNYQTEQQREAQAKLRNTTPAEQRYPTIVTGARGTANTVTGDDIATKPEAIATEKVKKSDEPQPYPRLEDAKEPVRSHTATGSAHPVDPGEPQPKPKQEDVKDSQPQRSSTETGEATPKDKDEVQPALKQEDAPKGLRQRSDTETGSVEPKPAVKGQETAKLRESSQSKAEGRTADKPKLKTTP